MVKKIIFIAITVLLIFVIYTLYSTGYFRTTENKFEGTILKKVPLPGAEDITISYIDSFAIISSTKRAVYPPKDKEYGGLYFLDLKNEDFTPLHLTANFDKPFAPHGISMFRKDSTYTIMAVNHILNKHSIEVFTFDGKDIEHIKTIENPALISPNDLVLIDENRFYITNDHGNLLFVASPRGFLIKVYAKEKDGSLNFIEDIPCGMGVDNIEIDNQGNLWSGGHPNLLRFKAYAKGKESTSPSEIIKINYSDKNNYTLQNVFTDDGRNISGSSVAIPFNDLILTGNVMDDTFLILKQE